MKLVSQERYIAPPNTLLYKMDPKDMPPRKTKSQRLKATNANASVPSKHWDKKGSGCR